MASGRALSEPAQYSRPWHRRSAIALRRNSPAARMQLPLVRLKERTLNPKPQRVDSPRSDPSPGAANLMKIQYSGPLGPSKPMEIQHAAPLGLSWSGQSASAAFEASKKLFQRFQSAPGAPRSTSDRSPALEGAASGASLELRNLPPRPSRLPAGSESALRARQAGAPKRPACAVAAAVAAVRRRALTPRCEGAPCPPPRAPPPATRSLR